MKTILLVLLAALALSNAIPFYSRNSPVRMLTADSFDKVVKRDNSISAVEFFAPWCGHCKKLKPEWERAAKKLKGIATVAAVNCDDAENKELCAAYDVQGFPTIKIFQGTDSVVDYEGERNSKSIIKNTLSLVDDLVEPISKKSHKKFLKKHKTMPVAIYFDNKEVPMVWKAMSSIYKDRMVFAAVTGKKDSKKLMKTYDIAELPAILVVVPPEDEDMDPSWRYYNGKVDKAAASVRSFLKMYALPLPEGQEEEDAIPKLSDPSCMEALCTAPGGLCAMLVVSTYDKAQATRAVDQMREVEETRKDTTVQFMWIDAIEQIDFIQSAFGISPSDYPQVVVFSPKKFRFSTFVGSFNVDAVASFIAGVLTGKSPTEPLRSGDSLPELAGTESRCQAMNEKRKKDIAAGQDTSNSRGSDSSDIDNPLKNFGGVMAPRAKIKRGGNKRGKPYTLTSEMLDDYIVNRNNDWIIRFVDTRAQQAEDKQTEEKQWKLAAAGLKNMVNFATVDLNDEADGLCKTYGITEPTVISISKSNDRSVSGTKYEGALTSEALSEYALSLLDKHTDIVTVASDEGEWQRFIQQFPLKPKIVLFSDKDKVPYMLKALAVDFEDYVGVAFVSSQISGAAQTFGVTEFPSLLIIQGGLDPADDGNAQRNVKIQAQQLPKPYVFNSVARLIDGIGVKWPTGEDGQPFMQESDDGVEDVFHDEL